MRKKAKLLKILLRKGKEPCIDLLKKMKHDLKREDMVDKMKEKSIYVRMRGTNNFCFFLIRVESSKVRNFHSYSIAAR